LDVTPKTPESGKPVRVVVPAVGIDLPVEDGFYNPTDGSWTLGNHKAYYATPTPLVNDRRGTTLIYGHNNRTAFKKLLLLPPNAEMTVYTDSSKVFHYTFTSAHEVSPNDTTLLALRGAPKVALQTCSGNWYEWRKLFVFKLTSVEKETEVHA
jgi:sortase (surface protein transpeptidase)